MTQSLRPLPRGSARKIVRRFPQTTHKFRLFRREPLLLGTYPNSPLYRTRVDLQIFPPRPVLYLPLHLNPLPHLHSTPLLCQSFDTTVTPGTIQYYLVLSHTL